MFIVTGAAGFIGSHLCDRLIADGHQVRGIDCFTDYYGSERKRANLAAAVATSNLEMVEADLADADLGPLLDGAEAVFHLAAQPGVRGSWGDRFEVYARNNVTATQRLLEALRTRPVPLVYASSSSIYGRAERFPVSEDDLPQPISPYGVTKLAGEHLGVLYSRAFGIPVTAVRYFTVYGPRQRPDMAFTRFARAALDGGTVEILGDGEQSRDFTYVTDAVDATIRALKGEPGRVYNIGGGSVATVNETLEMFEAATGRTIHRVHVPVAPGDPRRTSADTSRARGELGWTPSTSLGTGLEAHVAWARSAE